MALYKYRSLKNFKYFVDIIVNQRLYATEFTNLNDPMEGFFNSKGIDKETLEQVQKEKYAYKICSLSNKNDDIGLWTFYADEGRGCCIEVEVDDSSWQSKKITYNHDIPYYERLAEENSLHDIVEKILTSKLSIWKNEEEIRFIKETKNNFLPVKIKSIKLGYKVSTEDEQLIKELVEKIYHGNVPVSTITKTFLKREENCLSIF